MDPTSVGIYGTLIFLSARHPEKVVTAYPIDTQTVTIGRDPSCDIRLYYPDVSSVHCKLVFEERKAFLVVLGQNGLLVDDCAVFPSDTPSRPETIPLVNKSTLEIHSKRFRFEYPPKHARAAAVAALSTPAPLRRRLSLITSAKVFSPAPSADPMENLRVLQSPLRPYAGVVRQPSPLRGRGDPPSPDDEDVEDEEVVLVNGSHPRVVQEDKDLVIIEDMPAPAPEGAQPRHLAPPSVRQTTQTPRRRPAGRPSLHRAVLLRSAQRVVQDRAEEMEVEESMLVGEDVSDESDVLADNDGEGEEEEQDGEVIEEAYERVREDGEQRSMLSGWRKSLGSVWPFGQGSQESEGPLDSANGHVVDEVDEEREDEIEQDTENVLDGEEESEAESDANGSEEEPSEDEPMPQPVDEEGPAPPPVPAAPSTPVRGRRLGQFMTPQVPQTAPFAPATALRALHTPRRTADAWRVRDLVLPPNPQPAPAPRLTTARKVSAEEEQAIRARRKSAALALSPIKSGSVPLASLTETNEPTPTGPSVPRRPPRESDESDSGALLASMRRTVDDLRRRSLGTTLTPRPQSLSPRKKGGFSLFPAPVDDMPIHKGALDFGAASSKDDDDSMEVDENEYSEDDKENSPGPIARRSPPKVVEQDETPVVHSPAPARPPETPDLAPLRHMFSVPRPIGAATPAVKSVRGLYTQPRLPETPAMEGVAEMLAPPPPAPVPVSEPEPEVEPVHSLQTDTQSAPATSNQSDLQLEEQKETELEPEPEPEAPAPAQQAAPKPTTGSKKPPSRTAAPSKPPSTSRAPARPTRTTAPASRSKVQATPNASTMADDEMTPAVPEAAPRRLAAAATKSSAKPAAATVKRTRRPPGVRPDEAESSGSGSSRPPSRTTNATPNPTDDEDHAPAKRVPSKTATATKPPSKTKATAGPASVPAPARRTRQAEASTSSEAAATPATAPAPTRRSTRSTPSRDLRAIAENDAGATRARRTGRTAKPADIETVKEEVDEDSSPAPQPIAPRAPSRSGAKTPTTTAAASTTRTRASTRKTPVAGSTSESGAAGDKENTPDGAGPTTSRDDESEGSGGNVRKVVRTRSGLKTPATKEKEDPPIPTTATRATRVTRAKK